MKKTYIFIFSILWICGFSQSYYSLLSNTNWKIEKIQWDNAYYSPPAPFSSSGSGSFSMVADTYVFNTKLFNTIFGTLVFGENNANYFKILSYGQTIDVYEGDNSEAVINFDFLISLFYSEYQQGNYSIDYFEDNTGRHLAISNPTGKKIFYSAANLGTSETAKSEIVAYPNPATDIVIIKKLKSGSKLELIDTSGKLVKTISSVTSAKQEIDIKNLPSGIYYLKVNGQSIQKIIKN